ncbi:hypothetical protein DPMN_079905 [Dreissena polymorpha]|uniref:Uncharacterized protein n=1 Tax=Dreissena polymorpha TaxID=45954 RepID=A0A9D3YU10_DREPO|nr:hypothetical protein DPMN_079905 [Dreissena polymorpha]
MEEWSDFDNVQSVSRPYNTIGEMGAVTPNLLQEQSVVDHSLDAASDGPQFQQENALDDNSITSSEDHSYTDINDEYSGIQNGDANVQVNTSKEPHDHLTYGITSGTTVFFPNDRITHDKTRNVYARTVVVGHESDDYNMASIATVHTSTHYAVYNFNHINVLRTSDFIEKPLSTFDTYGLRIGRTHLQHADGEQSFIGSYKLQYKLS